MQNWWNDGTNFNNQQQEFISRNSNVFLNLKVTIGAETNLQKKITKFNKTTKILSLLISFQSYILLVATSELI